MNGPSLQRLTLLSLVFHLTFFLATFLVIKQSNRFVMPSPYVVNLVGPDVRTEGKGEAHSVSQTQSQAQIPPVTKEAKTAVEDTKAENTKAVSKTEEKHVSDQISALKAKKNVERIAKLRNMISLKSSGGGSLSGEGKPASPAGETGKGGGSLMDDYYSRITRDIWQNWVFPETGTKNLEAIISIKILRDGSLHVNRIEKSSGNSLFDRSALRAIAKASPVTPPPYEMEIGVRFYP
jgi:colicin import membrane protein